MTYDAYDQSIQSGKPVHLFHFIYEGADYRFTDLAKNVSALSNIWTKSGLKSGEIQQSQDFAKDELSIDFPRTESFAQLFIANNQETITSLTVYRGYLDDPDAEFITYWKGRVASTKVSSQLITLSCEPIFSSLSRPGLRLRYQRNCPYALYGRGCNLDMDDSSFIAEDTISAIDGLTITVTGASAEDDGYYTGGIIKASDGVPRFITDHTGNNITIRSAYSGFTVSSSVRLHPGCDRAPTTCRTKFNNLDNFGGYPYIPTRNPDGGSALI